MERIFLDYKITVWERCEINEPSEELIADMKRMIAEGKKANEIIADLNLDDQYFTQLLDTTSEMSLEDNEYHATIELVDDERNTICNNDRRTPPQPKSNG